MGLRQWWINKTVPGRGWTYDGSKVKGIEGTKDAVKAVLTNSPFSIDRMIEDVQTRLSDPNLDPDQRVDLQSLLAHLDGLSEYLLQPQRTKSFVPVKYTPTKGLLENGKHLIYMDTPMELNQLIETANDLKFEGKESKYRMNPYFRNYKVSIGTDSNKGDYVSYYKRWDYGSGEGQYDNKIDKFTGGKPFDVYGRLYLDDYYGVNSAPEKGDYYGGYLPEVEVYGIDPNRTINISLREKAKKFQRLKTLADQRHILLDNSEDGSWLTDDMWQNMSGDEILEKAKLKKYGGKLNYLNYIK